MSKLGVFDDMDRYRKRQARQRDHQAAERRRDRQANTPRPPRATKSFGDGESYTSRNHTPPVHGVTEDGQDVTAAFGTGRQEGETYLRDGHAQDNPDFWGPKEDKQHDHYDGRGGSTERGKYTGYGS